MPAKRAPLVPYLETDMLRLYRRPGTGSHLVVCFSGVGTDRGAWQPIEFVKFAEEAPEYHMLFVVDGGRSWLNHPGLIETIQSEVAAYRAAHGIERVVTLGNSMGGFMALALAGRLDASSALAISPQFSVHPDVVPTETRWRVYRREIGEWRVPDLSRDWRDETMYFVVHGADAIEEPHWRPIPLLSNLNHYIFPDRSHYLVRYLRENKALHPLIRLAIARRPRRARRIIEELGGWKRKHYERMLLERGA